MVKKKFQKIFQGTSIRHVNLPIFLNFLSEKNFNPIYHDQRFNWSALDVFQKLS